MAGTVSDVEMQVARGEPEVATRSASDVLRLAVATVLLIALSIVERVFGDTLIDFTSRLLQGLSAVPVWLLDAVVSVSRVVAVLFLAGGLVMGLVHSRWRMLLVVTFAMVVAVLLTIVWGSIDPADGAKVVHVDGLVPS